MNLTENLIAVHSLKQQVQVFWTLLHENTASLPQLETFKPEVRRLFDNL